MENLENQKFEAHFGLGADMSQDIICYKITGLSSLIGTMMADASFEAVYVVSIFDEVFVSSNIAFVAMFMGEIIKEMVKTKRLHEEVDFDEIKVYFQEYESYETAYKVALDMQEEKELCYDKK